MPMTPQQAANLVALTSAMSVEQLQETMQLTGCVDPMGWALYGGCFTNTPPFPEINGNQYTGACLKLLSAGYFHQTGCPTTRAALQDAFPAPDCLDATQADLVDYCGLNASIDGPDAGANAFCWTGRLSPQLWSQYVQTPKCGAVPSVTLTDDEIAQLQQLALLSPEDQAALQQLSQLTAAEQAELVAYAAQQSAITNGGDAETPTEPVTNGGGAETTTLVTNGGGAETTTVVDDPGLIFTDFAPPPPPPPPPRDNRALMIGGVAVAAVVIGGIFLIARKK
jgi:hypothetical protein